MTLPRCNRTKATRAPLPKPVGPAQPAAVSGPPQETSAAAVAGRPRSAQDEGSEFTGVARDVQRRPESGVLRFRIERHDASGNRLTPVPVEMLGTSFFGKVSNGDEIHLKGKLRHGTLRADYIGNLTTGAEVRGGCAGAVLKLFILCSSGLRLSPAGSWVVRDVHQGVNPVPCQNSSPMW